MRTTNFAYRLVLIASAAVLMTCGKNDPTGVDRPPVVDEIYPPTGPLISAPLADTLVFRVVALDPEKRPIALRFMLDDSVVSNASTWNYVVDDTGSAAVRCVVSDGSHEKNIRWDVYRYQPEKHPPRIVNFTPVESNPVMIINNQLEFIIKAVDDDGDALEYFYTVDDSLVTLESRFRYLANRIGKRTIEAVVSDGEEFATHVWQLTVTPVPDTIPPAEVQILTTETGEEPGEIYVEWLAVGADHLEGKASNYEVRTSPSPIEDEIDWSRASLRPGVPPPASPGEVMSMVVGGLTPAHFSYVTVRAVDNFGNLSPLGDSPGVYTRGMKFSGKVMDSMTGLPMANVYVHFINLHTTTDANGEFEFTEMPPLTASLVVSDDNESGAIGQYYDFISQYQVQHLDYLPIYLIPDYPMESTHFPDFLTFFIGMTKTLGLPYPNHQRRWEPPTDVYCPEFENGGLDYQATINQIVTDLNPYLGMNLLKVVDEKPLVGVSCVFVPNLGYDNFGVDVWSPDWYPVEATIEFRTVYTAATQVVFSRVVRHELGHALGLHHSDDTIHIMVAGIAPQVDNFSNDEIAVIRSRYHIPRGLAIASYIWE
jgi:hypothetical protein